MHIVHFFVGILDSPTKAVFTFAYFRRSVISCFPHCPSQSPPCLCAKIIKILSFIKIILASHLNHLTIQSWISFCHKISSFTCNNLSHLFNRNPQCLRKCRHCTYHLIIHGLQCHPGTAIQIDLDLTATPRGSFRSGGRRRSRRLTPTPSSALHPGHHFRATRLAVHPQRSGTSPQCTTGQAGQCTIDHRLITLLRRRCIRIWPALDPRLCLLGAHQQRRQGTSSRSRGAIAGGIDHGPAPLLRIRKPRWQCSTPGCRVTLRLHGPLRGGLFHVFC